MTDNTQELDGLLNAYLNACVYSQGNAWEEEEAVKKTKQAILDWHQQEIAKARVDGAIMGAKFGNAALRQYNIACKPMNLDEIRDVGIKQAEDWAKRQC